MPVCGVTSEVGLGTFGITPAAGDAGVGRTDLSRGAVGVLGTCRGGHAMALLADLAGGGAIAILGADWAADRISKSICRVATLSGRAGDVLASFISARRAV